MIWKPNVTVAALVEEAGRYLLVEEMTRTGPRLNQPAGHLEAAESLLEAVVRETLEETAHSFVPESLVGIYRWPEPGRSRTFLRFAFAGRLTGHDPARDLDDGIIRTLWLDRDQLRAMPDRLRSPQVLACIEDYEAGHRFDLNCLHDLIDPI